MHFGGGRPEGGCRTRPQRRYAASRHQLVAVALSPRRQPGKSAQSLVILRASCRRDGPPAGWPSRRSAFAAHRSTAGASTAESAKGERLDVRTTRPARGETARTAARGYARWVRQGTLPSCGKSRDWEAQAQHLGEEERLHSGVALGRVGRCWRAAASANRGSRKACAPNRSRAQSPPLSPRCCFFAKPSARDTI